MLTSCIKIYKLFTNIMNNNKSKFSRELFVPIINYVKNQEFDKALEQLENISDQNPDIINRYRGTIYLNKKDWKNSLKNYQKISDENRSFEILNNIGVSLYKLGRFSEASTQFKMSIDKNSSFLPAYENLSITYKLMGNYELSIKYILNSLKLNPKNNKLKNQLIDIFNYHDSKIFNNSIINLNNQIKNLNLKKQKNKLIESSSIKKILNNSEEILKTSDVNFNYSETQIFRKNKSNLNCKRHLSIFAKHNIIPRFCFDCYKVQLTLVSVLDLIKIYFYFNDLDLKNNNIRKCVVELRKGVSGNYKGYIFTNSIEEAKNISDIIYNDLRTDEINLKKIEIKHGCTEYYENYNLYKNVEKNITDKLYKNEWAKIEDEFDKEYFTIENIQERKFDNTINKFNLSDFLIIKNWLLYARALDDNSYKEIFSHEIKIDRLSKIEKDKISLRKIDK